MTTDAWFRRAEVPRGAWTADRLGRLLSGGFVLASMLIALLGPWPAWIGCAAAAFAGVQLLVTSLVGWCPLQALLRRLGAKEREEVFAEALLRTQDSRAEG
ncbi:MAG: DUF2892 domain-containing protein [Planctomycetota bacterium]|nr:DUF2892 domain-containing protein [Planctomycetota bacterium]